MLARSTARRAPLLNTDQLLQQAEQLARSHRTSDRHRQDRLLAQLTDNARVLTQTRHLLSDAEQTGRRLTPAGTWLLDNMYLIDEHVAIARRHLPAGYSRQLPQLASGSSSGSPRVYDIVLNAIAHVDGRVDADVLGRYVAAYQNVSPLTLGELWAIPIMLRLALIDNLQRIARRVIEDRLDRNRADAWADTLTRVAANDPKSLVLAVADLARSAPPAKSSFVTELARRLQGHGSALSMPLTWIEQWLSDIGATIEDMVQAENQQQAADQVSVSNSIASLRLLAKVDWRDFVEAVSVVERHLRGDPSGVYTEMDFATRDLYRHVVEQLARRSGSTEQVVAMEAVALAAQAAVDRQCDCVEAHVGYYLIDDGRAALDRALRIGGVARWVRTDRRSRLLLYTVAYAVIVAAGTWTLLARSWGELPSGWGWLVAGLATIAFSELAVALVNRAATHLTNPRPLPRLDLSRGIGVRRRTMVVVPTMLTTTDDVRESAEALEVCFLANREEDIYFALLTDFVDAPTETSPDDVDLLNVATREVTNLNTRYRFGGTDRFFLLHRPRLWNPSEATWMALERKRGKLAALNALLQTGDKSAFMRIEGNTELLGVVRYVITLDAGSQLPRDGARALVGTLAHPLNHARFDDTRRIVTAGYGILHPRVTTLMSGQRTSRYASLYGGETGIDPYTRVVSDVYQDLFGEGSFVGKGIYDVDAFERALAGRVPDNRVLSHDLLEGCYARAGLVSDVQLYEHHPQTYAADVARRHRWIRGDWQLLPWLMPRVARRRTGREPNPLSLLSLGKLIDNLRRSLFAAATTALFIIGWTTRRDAATWTLVLAAIVVLPPAVSSAIALRRHRGEMSAGAALRVSLTTIRRNVTPAVLTLICLPYEAYYSLDAIVRTWWRMAVSRRHLLQWRASSDVERSLTGGLGASLRAMWFAPALAVITAAVVIAVQPRALWVASPLLLAWAGSPLVMWWLGQPRTYRRVVLDDDELVFLRRLARRTWAFFETYVTAADHWLPPDNVQMEPSVVVARRTSPTNIGLSLLADVAAYDFGYLPASAMSVRIAHTLETLASLPRHRGHFYNWYNTATAQPLPPHYVSTVDSGNLCGHLLTLRQALLALPDAPVLSPRAFHGLADTFLLLDESNGSSSPACSTFERRVHTVCQDPPASLAYARDVIDELCAMADTIVSSDGLTNPDATVWANALLRQCVTLRDDLADFASAWPEAHIPTLNELASHPRVEPSTARRAGELIGELERLADVAAQCAQADWRFLYDERQRLLSIGYHIDDDRLDEGVYDLLASEARLATFVAIAHGQIPEESWFALGRLLTDLGGEITLLSWSGSMFEYLMPLLVMPSYTHTLLDETAHHCVERQIAYGRARRVPWGISESAYNTVDADGNYQYRAFGVPGLGLQRQARDDLVISPYATMLALMVQPDAACRNLQRMTDAGFAGRFGMYEAVDYTPQRLPPGQDHGVIASYMVHHQAMGLLALDHLLGDQPMQARFAGDPALQATMLLIQERVPQTGVIHVSPPTAPPATSPASEDTDDDRPLRVFPTAASARPAVQLLSNGRYHVMVTNAGGGYSRRGDLAVTRWRQDGTSDDSGVFCYLRDTERGDIWSTTYQPTAVPVDDYQAIFSDAKAEFRSTRHGLSTHTEIAVSPEDDIELRRLRLDNRTREPRTVDVITYAEVVLAPPVSDELHPAYSNLFVQTELVPSQQAIVCARRARSPDESTPWMFHLVAVHDADVDHISYETDRSRFIGRGNTLTRPDGATQPGPLSNSAGSVLDPIVAIRCTVTLPPGTTTTIDMVVGVGTDRGDCDELIAKYRDRRLADRVFELAWTHSQVVSRQIGASAADSQLYERLAGLIIYPHRALRVDTQVLQQNQRGQSGLWGQSISGDHPIALVRITDAAHVNLVRQMVQAHAYLRLKGVIVDLVIWNDDQGGYRQQLHDQILGLIAAGQQESLVDRPGGIFLRPSHQLSPEDRVLLQSVAHVVVSDDQGSLAEQIGRRPPTVPTVPKFIPTRPYTPTDPASSVASDGATADLLAHNGLGGFSADGREYIIDLHVGQTTPAPWSNVIANATFGCVVTDSTPGYTWADNAHEFRLTPWHNDPVTDASGEACYLRDDETGHSWSPMPSPRRGTTPYRIRHGFGYSVYEHVEDDIASELWIYVDPVDPVKYSVLKLRNVSGVHRRLSATGYVEWILGDLHANTELHVTTALDPIAHLITAQNRHRADFADRVAFFDADPPAGQQPDQLSYTGDRTEFLGRNGNPHDPAGLRNERLSGRLGPALDPCTAIQVLVELDADQQLDVVFRLGVGTNLDDARDVAGRSRGAATAQRALEAVHHHWRRTLDTVRVATPEPAIDAMANGWLLYQTIACRYLARSGYYQSGGAFGFRDQLQDTMAMLHAEPDVARGHLLLCASRQFLEGDVQHWWHPPTGRGVRTRCSDDYLWLPFATARYVEVTGDHTVLDELVGYLDGRQLNADEESYFDLPGRAVVDETLYQHCVRALRRGMRLLGERGLPLMGSGDWNDGMNRVGKDGRGESVWLGFFLHDTLVSFEALARSRSHDGVAQECTDAVTQLRANLHEHAWDGGWYRRAWFDDGTPLGSAGNAECAIDSIAQSWSVLSGAADPERATIAMAALDTHLVRSDAGLIQLLDPPFDSSTHDPGYIRGYVPGVRENGGQYTHAAVWAIMAFARLGHADTAWDLLRMINPVEHGRADNIDTYKVEPYVLAADVYAVEPHVGRGGWTWYTGSAGWMYRLIIESLLGLQRHGDVLTVAPCIPSHWPGYEASYRYGDTTYRIRIRRSPDETARLTIDGIEADGWDIGLHDDHVDHVVDGWISS